MIECERGRSHVVRDIWLNITILEARPKNGGRVIRHTRYFVLQLAESYLTPTLFRQILRRVERLSWHPA